MESSNDDEQLPEFRINFIFLINLLLGFDSPAGRNVSIQTRLTTGLWVSRGGVCACVHMYIYIYMEVGRCVTSSLLHVSARTTCFLQTAGSWWFSLRTFFFFPFWSDLQQDSQLRQINGLLVWGADAATKKTRRKKTHYSSSFTSSSVSSTLGRLCSRRRCCVMLQMDQWSEVSQFKCTACSSLCR